MIKQPELTDPGYGGDRYYLGAKYGVTTLKHSYLDLILQMALPGVVIFVHGVNSDGEWYEQAEEGLCKGLNSRLARRDEDMAYPTVEGGQLTPERCMPELSDDGYLNPERNYRTFIESDHHSPVIRFRWGYKASLEELQLYGDSIYLNEENYWGGGPFANGCTALPDLWSQGLTEELFLWLRVQHLNPTPDRQVFSCPPRPYFVLAALRLAKLIASIRDMQADVPITVVCHSQGNMIGMAAAFLGDRMPGKCTAQGDSARAVADSYVLCNAPYSLLQSNFLESWTESHMTDREGGTGRVSGQARIDTLRAFLDIVRQPAAPEQDPQTIGRFMDNHARGFDIVSDRMKYGYGVKPDTRRRVTLYCNPHDQVISATTIQGIGWRGLSQQEIDACGGRGLFCQRVFAHGFDVGVKGDYHFWQDHYGKPRAGSPDYWYPRSQGARYSVRKGLEADRSVWASIFTYAAAPVMWVVTRVLDTPINALPDKDWSIPIDAPALPPFKPEAMRFGARNKVFDEGYDRPGEHRNPARERTADDPYAVGGAGPDLPDAPKGNRDSEASLRYADHARLRMQAKREKLVKNEEKVTQEDDLNNATAEYKAWRGVKIRKNLDECLDVHATDHSTIMTNPHHAEKALAYDVAVGMCKLTVDELHQLRIAADWQVGSKRDFTFVDPVLADYSTNGLVAGKTPYAWAHDPGSEGSMPGRVANRREKAASAPPRMPGD